MVYAMLCILQNGGLGDPRGEQKGVLNFDAKLRRDSTDINDIIYAIVGAMDAWALAAKVAQKIIDEGLYSKIVDRQYVGWGESVGREIADTTFVSLRASARTDTNPIKVASGEEEKILRLINAYITDAA